MPKTASRMNCQLDIPSKSSRSPQVSCPINLLNRQQQPIPPLAMKEQVLPDIPQEDMAQTQSMYEQLRKTTQKWFAPSHRRIFTTSPQPRQASQSVPDEEKVKMLALMREQIEIACSEYTARMGTMLQEQAKKIKLLGDLLVKNQIELNRKNKQIADLTQYIEERPNFHEENLEFGLRLKHTEQELREIVARLAVLQKRQVGAEKKHREQVQRIVASSSRKVREMSEEFEERVDKLEKIVALNQPDSRNHLRRNSGEPAMGKWVQMFSGELQDLRQDVESLRGKEYRYQNYRLDELESVLLNLKARVQRCQQKRVSTLKSSQATLMSKTDSHYVPAKIRFLSKYKSLISSRGQRASSNSKSNSSGSQSQVQQTLNQGNIQRLRKIISQLSMKTPVRLQIDQTGYAKLADTGMYLVDSLGDGFEFTPQELQYLTSQRIIAT